MNGYEVLSLGAVAIPLILGIIKLANDIVYGKGK